MFATVSITAYSGSRFPSAGGMGLIAESTIGPRVAIVHWGSRGAGPELTLGSARALQEAGLDVVASCSTYADNFEDLRELDIPLLAVKTYKTKLGFLFRSLALPVHLYRFRRFLRQHAVTVVVSPMYSLWHSVLPSLLVGRKRSYIAAVHDFTDHPGEEHWLKEICRNAELRRADLLLCFSEHVRTQLQERVDTPSALVPLPSPDSATSPRVLRSGSEVVIGFFGRILPYKGLSLLIEAMPLMTARIPGLRLKVLGSGNVSAELLAIDLPIDWHVGWAEKADIADFFDAVDLVVLPYLEASQSGVVAQAFSWGVPVVVTPVGGLSEQVAQSGAGVVAGEVTPQSIADAVVNLASDPDAYRQMSAAGIRHAEGEGSWGLFAQKLVPSLVSLHRKRP